MSSTPARWTPTPQDHARVLRLAAVALDKINLRISPWQVRWLGKQNQGLWQSWPVMALAEPVGYRPALWLWYPGGSTIEFRAGLTIGSDLGWLPNSQLRWRLRLDKIDKPLFQPNKTAIRNATKTLVERIRLYRHIKVGAEGPALASSCASILLKAGVSPDTCGHLLDDWIAKTPWQSRDFSVKDAIELVVLTAAKHLGSHRKTGWQQRLAMLGTLDRTFWKVYKSPVLEQLKKELAKNESKRSIAIAD